MGMRDEVLRDRGAETMVSAETLVGRAIVGINSQKARLVALKGEVDASVTAGDGIYSSADQTELIATMQKLKADVQALASSL